MPPAVPRLLVALVLAAGAGCSSPRGDAGRDPPRTGEPEVPPVDRLAHVFSKYVHGHYATRLAAEQGQPSPSKGARLGLREELARALRDVGVDLPEEVEGGAALRQAMEAVRAKLVAHEYVFLPLPTEEGGPDLGIALAHVRAREPARSQELWGRTVRYKLILYETLVPDYPTWRARTLQVEGPVYSPGRFSGETVYVDHEELVRRAKTLPGPYAAIGLEGLKREVELRQAAYLLFSSDVPASVARDPAARDAAIERVHERVLLTALRHGDPDVALADVRGLAASERAPRPLQAAARRVLGALPAAATDLPGKEERTVAIREAARRAFPE